jgi:hypothetical protein
MHAHFYLWNGGGPDTYLSPYTDSCPSTTATYANPIYARTPGWNYVSNYLSEKRRCNDCMSVALALKQTSETCKETATTDTTSMWY